MTAPEVRGLRLAQTACGVGVLFAAVSVYWGLGGPALRDTAGGSLAAGGGAAAALAVWGAVVAKVVAACLPLWVVRARFVRRWERLAWAAAWLEAGILSLYGLVWTAVGLLVQANVLEASADADHRSLAWHAFLWDPWFLIWGLLVIAALVRARSAPRPSAAVLVPA